MASDLRACRPIAVTQLAPDIFSGLGQKGQNGLITFLALVFRVITLARAHLPAIDGMHGGISVQGDGVQLHVRGYPHSLAHHPLHFSEESGSVLGFPDSRPSPHLSFFESTSKVRALSSTGITRFHRSYDPLRPPLTAILNDDVAAATFVRRVSPPITQIAFLTCRAHYRGGRDSCTFGFFPAPVALPVMQAGRLPRLPLRGRLELHPRYGRSDCSPTEPGLCHEASVRAVPLPNGSSATEPCRWLLGWVLPHG